MVVKKKREHQEKSKEMLAENDNSNITQVVRLKNIESKYPSKNFSINNNQNLNTISFF